MRAATRGRHGLELLIRTCGVLLQDKPTRSTPDAPHRITASVMGPYSTSALETADVDIAQVYYPPSAQDIA